MSMVFKLWVNSSVDASAEPTIAHGLHNDVSFVQ